MPSLRAGDLHDLKDAVAVMLGRVEVVDRRRELAASAGPALDHLEATMHGAVADLAAALSFEDVAERRVGGLIKGAHAGSNP